MKRATGVVLMLLMSFSTAYAADKGYKQETAFEKTEAKGNVMSKQVKEVSAETSVPAAPVESEAQKRLKGIQAQEEWVTRLKKQLDGETNQLKEMRRALAESYHLDLSKLEKGTYKYDEKSGKFVE